MCRWRSYEDSLAYFVSLASMIEQPRTILETGSSPPAAAKQRIQAPLMTDSSACLFASVLQDASPRVKRDQKLG